VGIRSAGFQPRCFRMGGTVRTMAGPAWSMLGSRHLPSRVHEVNDSDGEELTEETEREGVEDDGGLVGLALLRQRQLEFS
jgi:hypothetical protein